MESSQLYAATLTHYSTEQLTTGPDYDPLLLLLALTGDVHPNSGPSRYPCSVCFKNVTSQGTSYLCTRCSYWVYSRCSGLRNAADYRKANGWICAACMTPPQPRAPSPPPSPAHHVRQVVQHTTVQRQWYQQQTDGTKHLPRGARRQSGGHSCTLVRQDRQQGPVGGLLFFIHNSASFTRKRLLPMSKNDSGTTDTRCNQLAD